jgi:outer membrane lipoprotein-sorting protein
METIITFLFIVFGCAIGAFLIVSGFKDAADLQNHQNFYKNPEVQFNEFIYDHPKLKDKTTIKRIKLFIKKQYSKHLMLKELYRLYLLDCDATGRTPMSYRKWKFAYGL